MSELTAALFGLAGAALGASITFIGTHLNRRAEQRRHYRELGVTVAQAKFSQSMELAQKAANASGQIIPVPPFDAHLIHAIRLMEIISDSRLSAKEIGEQIAALTKFTQEVTSTVKGKL